MQPQSANLVGDQLWLPVGVKIKWRGGKIMFTREVTSGAYEKLTCRYFYILYSPIQPCFCGILTGCRRYCFSKLMFPGTLQARSQDFLKGGYIDV